ncbi:MAG TPA: antitoxin Xre-like helix-turn-helix domain-containing protein [Polyangiaceae bacterium]
MRFSIRYCPRKASQYRGAGARRIARRSRALGRDFPCSICRPGNLSKRQAEVLSKAAVRAGAELGMSQQELANVIGVSPATMSRLVSTGRALGGKELELVGHQSKAAS